MVAAICGSTQKEPIVVGKPSPFLMDFLLQKCSNWNHFINYHHVNSGTESTLELLILLKSLALMRTVKLRQKKK